MQIVNGSVIMLGSCFFGFLLSCSRFNVRPAGSGGGRPPPGGAFIHHNFRYGPEPPAYKTPRPEYTSYVRKEPERPPPQDRHVVERSFDDRLFEQFMRKFWKEQAEEETLDPDDVELDDDGPDLSGAPDIANVIIRKPSEIPKEPLAG